jgi:hypothetical protein
MKRTAEYQHPTTYEAIVAHQCARHDRRLHELKRAEKAIRAVSADLATLAKRGLLVEVGEYSLYLVDHTVRFHTKGRSKSALFISTGVFRETANRFVEAFVGLGWVVQALDINRSLSQVLLHRPRTEFRIVLDLSEEFPKTLESREVQQ